VFGDDLEVIIFRDPDRIDHRAMHRLANTLSMADLYERHSNSFRNALFAHSVRGATGRSINGFRLRVRRGRMGGATGVCDLAPEGLARAVCAP
jgi:hypothetical protein